jgi:antitoxin component YwqK of YwqJK toxin-antitoxin module
MLFTLEDYKLDEKMNKSFIDNTIIKNNMSHIKKYYDKKQLKLKEEYINNCSYKSYYETGEKHEEYNLVNGIKDGMRSDKSMQIDGIYRSYHKKGLIKEEYKNVNGLKDGIYKFYYENGQINIECNYVNGLKNGKYISYNIRGMPIIECNYVNGILDGPYVKCEYKYNIDHTKFQKRDFIKEKEEVYYYENGLRQGSYKSYYSNGIIKEEGNFINDKLSGQYKFYHNSGLMYREVDVNGPYMHLYPNIDVKK